MNLGDFISFRKMIIPMIITILYVIVALIITIGSFVIMFIGGVGVLGLGGVVGGIIALIFGNLIWRMVCEYMVVIFRIHSELVSFNNKFGSGGSPVPAAPVPAAPVPPAPVPPYPVPPAPVAAKTTFCSNCGAGLASGAKFCPNCGKAV